jgi:large subunit ribosomal protein L21
MYSIIKIGGHQYKVKAGDVVDVQKLEGDIDSTLVFDEVLFVSGETPLVGAPTVDGAKVTAKVVRQDRGRKMLVFKRKPGMYQKKNGHRQSYTALQITQIDAGNGTVTKA